MEQYKNVTIFFNSLPERRNLLRYIFQLNCLHTEKRKIISGNCNTKWSARDEEYEHLYLALSYIAGSFKIINGALPEIRDLDKTPTDGWNPKAKIEITSYFKALRISVCCWLITLYSLLHPKARITDRRLGKTVDIVKACEEAATAKQTYIIMQGDFEHFFHTIFTSHSSCCWLIS